MRNTTFWLFLGQWKEPWDDLFDLFQQLKGIDAGRLPQNVMAPPFGHIAINVVEVHKGRRRCFLVVFFSQLNKSSSSSRYHSHINKKERKRKNE
jgi:hypothetical protein